MTMNHLPNCSPLPHFCGFERCGGNVPAKINPLCSAPGPHTHFDSPLTISCARVKGHDGPHSAYTFSISTPTEWAP